LYGNISGVSPRVHADEREIPKRFCSLEQNFQLHQHSLPGARDGPVDAGFCFLQASAASFRCHGKQGSDAKLLNKLRE
jgi:hypothetical protein